MASLIQALGAAYLGAVDFVDWAGAKHDKCNVFGVHRLALQRCALLHPEKPQSAFRCNQAFSNVCRVSSEEIIEFIWARGSYAFRMHFPFIAFPNCELITTGIFRCPKGRYSRS